MVKYGKAFKLQIVKQYLDEDLGIPLLLKNIKLGIRSRSRIG